MNLLRVFILNFLLLLDFFSHFIYLCLHLCHCFFAIPINLILNVGSFYFIPILIILILKSIYLLMENAIGTGALSLFVVYVLWLLIGVFYRSRSTVCFTTLGTKLNLEFQRFCFLWNLVLVIVKAKILFLHTHLYLIYFAFQLILHRIILLLVVELLLLNMRTQLRIIELLVDLILQMLNLVLIHFFLFGIHVLDFGCQFC